MWPISALIAEESVALFQAATDEHWGADCSKMMEAISVYDFDRHFQIARSTCFRVDFFLNMPIECLVAEKTGNLQHCIEINERKCRSMDSYVRAAPPPMCEMPYFLLGGGIFVGVEVHHQHLQPRREFLQHFKYLGINNAQQVEETYRTSAEYAWFRSMSRSSADGLHHLYSEHALVALTQAVLTFCSADTTRNVELSWLEELPQPDASTLHDTNLFLQLPVTTRVLVAEVFEQQGRHAEAIQFAQTDLQDYHNLNMLAKVRAGRVLGRCHAALGQHMLSVSAFDAAIDLAQSRKLLLSEALSVRGRAAAGRTGLGGGEQHWDERMGKQRLAEVMGRMQGPLVVLERVLDLPKW
jgi:hypothetical protein